MQTSGWCIGKRFLGAVYNMIIKRNIIDNQTRKDDREAHVEKFNYIKL